MEFLKGLKEAQSLGISREVFLEIWKKEGAMKLLSKKANTTVQGCVKPLNFELHKEASSMETINGNLKTLAPGNRPEDNSTKLCTMSCIVEQLTLQSVLLQEGQQLHQSAIQKLHQKLETILTEQISSQEHLQMKLENGKKILEQCHSSQEQIHQKVQDALPRREILEEQLNHKVDQILDSQKHLYEKIDKISIEHENSQKLMHEKIDNISAENQNSDKQLHTNIDTMSTKLQNLEKQLYEKVDNMSSESQSSEKRLHEKFDKISFESRNFATGLHHKIDKVLSENENSEKQLCLKIDKVWSEYQNSEKQLHEKIDNICSENQNSDKQLHKKMDSMSSKLQNSDKQLHEKVDKLMSENQISEKLLHEKIEKISSESQNSEKLLHEKIDKISSENRNSEKQLHHKIDEMLSENQKLEKQRHEKIDKISFNQQNSERQLQQTVHKLSSESQTLQKSLHEKIDKLLSENQNVDAQLLGKIDRMSLEDQDSLKKLLYFIGNASVEHNSSIKLLHQGYNNTLTKNDQGLRDELKELSLPKTSITCNQIIEKIPSDATMSQKDIFEYHLTIHDACALKRKSSLKEINNTANSGILCIQEVGKMDSVENLAVDGGASFINEQLKSNEKNTKTKVVHEAQLTGSETEKSKDGRSKENVTITSAEVMSLLDLNDPIPELIAEKLHLVSENQSFEEMHSADIASKPSYQVTNKEAFTNAAGITVGNNVEIMCKQEQGKLDWKSTNVNVSKTQTSLEESLRSVIEKLEGKTLEKSKTITSSESELTMASTEFHEVTRNEQTQPCCTEKKLKNLYCHSVQVEKFTGEPSKTSKNVNSGDSPLELIENKEMKVASNRQKQSRCTEKKQNDNLQSHSTQDEKTMKQMLKTPEQIISCNLGPQLTEKTSHAVVAAIRTEQIHSCSVKEEKRCLLNDSTQASNSSSLQWENKCFEFTIISVVQNFQKQLTKSFDVVCNDYKLRVLADFYDSFIEIYLQSVYTNTTLSLSWPVRFKISMALADKQSNTEKEQKSVCGAAVNKSIVLKKPQIHGVSEEVFVYFFKKNVANRYVVDDKLNIDLTMTLSEKK